MKTIKFNSITEVLNFINTHETSGSFKNNMASVKGESYFTGTKDFDEAMNLLKYGWDSGAQKLNTKLSAVKTGNDYKTKQFYSVAGYQCSVPRYLQGIPTNMVNSKCVVTKNKVTNITKDISYSAKWNTDDMVEQGVKFVELVNKIESEGTRCNVYVMFAIQQVNNSENKVCFKIKIKDSSQRTNLKQIAFPLAHPSMLRRIFFALIEKHEATENMFIGHGKPVDFEKVKESYHKEYLVPKELEEGHITNINKYWCD